MRKIPRKPVNKTRYSFCTLYLHRQKWIYFKGSLFPSKTLLKNMKINGRYELALDDVEIGWYTSLLSVMFHQHQSCSHVQICKNERIKKFNRRFMRFSSLRQTVYKLFIVYSWPCSDFMQKIHDDRILSEKVCTFLPKTFINYHSRTSSLKILA